MPVNGRFLLDTNIIIALFAKDPIIREKMANASEVFVPCIALGELYFGAHRSSRAQDNIICISEFALHSSVVECNGNTADIYGRLKNRLRRKGQPIPENDLWIAAVARQYSLTLVTRDKHFDAIEDLMIEMW